MTLLRTICVSHGSLKYLWKLCQIFVAISRFMAPIGPHWVALHAVELNALFRKTPRPHNWLLYGLFPAPWKHTFSSEPPFLRRSRWSRIFESHLFWLDAKAKMRPNLHVLLVSNFTVPSLSFQNVPQHNLEASHLHLLALFANNICFSFFICFNICFSWIVAAMLWLKRPPLIIRSDPDVWPQQSIVRVTSHWAIMGTRCMELFQRTDGHSIKPGVTPSRPSYIEEQNISKDFKKWFKLVYNQCLRPPFSELQQEVGDSADAK